MKSKNVIGIVFLLSASLIFNSCGKFRLIEVYGLTNDYNKLSQETKDKVFTFESIESAKQGYAYKITGAQLRRAIQPYEKCLVYFLPGSCYKDHCISAHSVETYASANEYNLLLLDISYASLEKLLKEVKASPILIVNNEHYNEKRIRDYVPLFMTDFLGDSAKNNPEMIRKSFYFFEHGRLISATNDLPGFNNP